MMNAAANAYSKTSKETASKERLMVMLFQAALRHIRNGADFYEKGKSVEGSTVLGKATDIVAELMATLDRDKAPELCDQLTDIYTFVADRLLRASAQRDGALAREAARVFAPVVDGFTQAVASLEAADRARP